MRDRLPAAVSDDPGFGHPVPGGTIVRADRQARRRRRRGPRLGPSAAPAAGWLGSELRPAARGPGCPARIVPAAGRAGDAPRARPLPEGRPAGAVVADAAHGADHRRRAVAAGGAGAVIPSNPSRSRRPPLEGRLCKGRRLVGRCFAKLERFRRAAARHERTTRTYRAVVTLAATVPRLR